jgi:SAM-dependent methyltransferase
MDNVEIRWENSAQSKMSPPNPCIVRVIDYFKNVIFQGQDISGLRVADQGCGNLRHFEILRRSFRHIVLIDTVLQMNRVHKMGALKITLADYITNLNGHTNRYQLLNNIEFKRAKLNLDIVLCACVMDVVPAKVRREVIQSAASNLKRGGYYCVIVPRNDQTITSRCSRSNSYEDGHIFCRQGFCTFYANFSNGAEPHSHLMKLLKDRFVQLCDLSVYRQLCLIMQKKA